MGYLAAGFLALWLLVTVYVVFISMRQRRLEVELTGLEESLNESQPGNN